jgi:GntR family transcriptional regulator/MocR family aminotransferase
LLLPLREALAEYLRAARAVRCEPEQVVITAGTQQGVDLAIRVLFEPGDEAWVEDPGYPPSRLALAAAGVRTRPVPVDAQGLDVRAGLRGAPHARAAFVTPSNHYPLGVVLSMPRRLELLAWARATGAWIVEDDFDSEFRYAGRPLASLQGLDDGERVIYVGTFNKVLFAGLRLGFVVVPRPLLRGGDGCQDRSALSRNHRHRMSPVHRRPCPRPHASAPTSSSSDSAAGLGLRPSRPAFFFSRSR